MSDTTRIMDLPENVTMQMNTRERGNGLNTSYSPMDIHPNPYGHPPPSIPSMPTPSSAPNTSGQIHQQSIPRSQQQLPSRDIPSDMNHIVQDEHVQPNYIPPVPDEVKKTAEYMKQYEEVTAQKIEAHRKGEKEKSRIDSVYEEGQIPLLVAVLFFIIHMPVVNQQLHKYLSFLKLYDTDGHFSMYGLIWQSALFGGLFYSLSKGIHMAANF